MSLLVFFTILYLFFQHTKEKPTMQDTIPSTNISRGFLILSILVFGTFGYFYETGLSKLVMMLLGVLTGGIAYLLFKFLFQKLGGWFSKLPLGFNAAILGILSSLVLAKGMGFRMPDNIYYPAGIVAILFTILFFISLNFIKNKKSKIAWLGIVAPFLAMFGFFGWLMQEGKDPYAKDLPPPFSIENKNTLSNLGLKNPATLGELAIQKFTYGNGTDKKREEFAEGVKFKTPTVDASLLLPDWKDKKKKWRERYWKFGVKEFPLNGRVFLPEGEGTFPLVLIVHGNHSMIDYSDGGYDYLGELLASRGMIAVSVDENFINGHWSGDFRGKEMPTRAWLLLKHLEQWKKWNNDSSHEFYQKIDMNQIMLVGHSRGGEAVSIAAAFNKLPHFPDNALEKFDFNFNIKGVVSIAPTDYRYHRQINLENINYLSLQGSYDSDEISFWGMRPYRRMKFTADGDYFKAGVYMHRANHGQFNSTWGRTDFGPPTSWILNTRPMLSGDDQREAAKVFITAFAEAILKGNKNYLPLFHNAEMGKDWLPENYYLTHFQDKDDFIFQNFEEDIDLISGKNNIVITSENLKIWREENLSTRDNGSQENNSVVLGWDYGEKIKADSLATYTLQFPDSVFLKIDTANHLLLTLGAGNHKELDKLSKKEKDKKEKRKAPVLDFEVQLKDINGATKTISIREIKNIAPPLKIKFTKLASLNKDMFGAEWEVHLETFALPLNQFKSSQDFEIKKIKELQFIFNKCEYGVIVIDDIGFSEN